MRWRPWDKPLGEVTAQDVEGLVTREIEEGEFIEYKREWAPRLAARSAASLPIAKAGER